jgi:hypothetical protein
MSNQKDFRSIVNSSGFLFQLRVVHEIERSRKAHGWEILVAEHPWRDKESSREGYIDLILGKGIVRIVIECKRVKEGAWVFLLPNATQAGKNDTHMRCMWTAAQGRKSGSEPLQDYRSGWHDYYPQPPSYISEFCVVRGTGEDDRPLLERTAGRLIEAVEALALEELFVTFNNTPGHKYIYVPVIVTNADLQVCRFGTDAVPLADGRLPEGAGEFESVPLVRFRKTLTVRPTKYTLIQTIRDSHRDKMRTVVVVNAERLTDLLTAWSFGLLEGQPPLTVTI